MPAMIEKIIKVSEISDQMIPQQCEEPPYFFANTLASELLTFRKMRSSHCEEGHSQPTLIICKAREQGLAELTISHTLYNADMTPMKSTTNRKGSACLMNQHATSNPTLKSTVTIVSQSRRAHHSVSKKQTASTRLATLLATISNPQKIKSAPIKEDPRYPAGKVIAQIPPRMCVTPPSLGSNDIDSTFPPVQQAVAAWLNSWKAMTSILKGHRDQRRYGTFHKMAMIAT